MGARHAAGVLLMSVFVSDDEIFALREKPPERITWALARMNREALRRARRALKERAEGAANDEDAE